MPFTLADHPRLFYRWSGTASRPVLVLSHSLGASQRMWKPQEQQLGEHFRLLLYDHRGHGQSQVPAGPYTIEQFGRDLIELLDHLRLAQVHFCGLSLGAMVGLWLAQNAPQRLGKLVVSNTAANIESTTLLAERVQKIQIDGLKSVADNVLARWFSDGFRADHPDVVRRSYRMLLKTSSEAYVATSQAVCQCDLRMRLQEIRTPTLVITGHYDLATPETWGKALVASISDARHVSLDAAHLSNVEAPAQYNRAVLEFLMS